METKTCIEARRSIRSYTKEMISRELVEDIINCGRLAPSSKNSQPWYFVIVTKTTKNKIADMMLDYTKNTDETLERERLGYASSVTPTAHIIKQAPILILLLREKNDKRNVVDYLSIGACVENMCLRATDLGIGSLWIRDIVKVANDVVEMIGHEDMELNCALALGYTSQLPNPRPRKELQKIMEWYPE